MVTGFQGKRGSLVWFESCSRWFWLFLWLMGGRVMGDRVEREVVLEVETGSVGTLFLRVDPSLGTLAYRVTERLPAGVEWLGVSGGGVFDPANRTVTWRAFSDGWIAVLSCQVRFSGEAGLVRWVGEADFDGRITPVQGRMETLVVARSLGKVTRRLEREPWTVQLGEWVGLDAVPAAGTLLWVVEEEVTGVDRLEPGLDGRLLDARRIRWGPFTDDRPRELRYRVIPGVQPGVVRFEGRAGFQGQVRPVDGVASVQVLRPQSARIRRNLPSGVMPGDTIEVRLDLELPESPGIYSVRETVPSGWQVVDTVPGARLESGRSLVWGPLIDGGNRVLTYRVRVPVVWPGLVVWEGTLDWMDGSVVVVGDAVLEPVLREPVRAMRSLPEIYVVGQSVEVRVLVEPGSGTGLYRLVEPVPSGWTWVPGSGGRLISGQIHFGPFFDSESRWLSYRVTPGSQASSPSAFAGWVDSAEGQVMVGGAMLILRRPPPSGTFQQLLPPFFVPGGLVTVTNRVQPDPEVVFLVVEQQVPVGWEVVESLPSGRMSEDGRRWIWGPLPDGRAEELVLRLRAPSNAVGSVQVPVWVNLGEIVLTPPGQVVLPVNLPPRMPQLFEVFGRKNEPVRMRIPVDDPETPTTMLDLRFSVSDPVLFPVSGRSATVEAGSYVLVLEPALNRVGSDVVTVEASDGFNEVRRSFRVEVLDRNTPPTWEGWDLVEGAMEDSSGVVLRGFGVGDLDAGLSPLRVRWALPAGFAWKTGELVSGVTHSWGDHAGIRVMEGPLEVLNRQLERMEFVPAADWFGAVPVEVEVDDLGATGPGGAQRVLAQLEVNLTPVNDPPVFDPLLPGVVVRVFEAGPTNETRVDGFLTGLSPGASNEGGQRLTPVVWVSDPQLFESGPTFTREGTLVFRLVPGVVGRSRVEFHFVDDGGIENGGLDRSRGDTFEIEVVGVNHAPTAVRGDDRMEWELTGSGELPVEVRWDGFVRDLDPGHPREVASGQSVRVEAWVVPSDLVMGSPRVDGEGALTMVLRPGAMREGTLFWQVVDDGPGDGPHRNRSEIGRVALRVAVGNVPPAVFWDGPWTLFRDPSGEGWRGGLPGITPGRFEWETDRMDVERSSGTASWEEAGLGSRSAEVELLSYRPVVLEPYPALGVLEIRMPSVPEGASGLRLQLRLVDRGGAEVLVERPLLLAEGSMPQRGLAGGRPPWNRVDVRTGLPLLLRDEDFPSGELALGELYPELDGRRGWSWHFWDLIAGPARLEALDGVESVELGSVADVHGEVWVQLILTEGTIRVPWAFVIRVSPVPDPPRVEPVPELEIPENASWSYVLRGMSVENPGVQPVWRLLEGPEALVLLGGGGLVWTPTELQGPGRYRVRVRASEVDGSLWTDMEFFIRVMEVNGPPGLMASGPWVGVEHERFRVWMEATDPDWPVQQVQVGLVDGPPGLVLIPGSGGAWVEWTPGEEHGGGQWPFRVRVTDSGEPPLTRELAFVVAVLERNDPPAIQRVRLSPDQLGRIPEGDWDRVVSWVILDEDTSVLIPLTIGDPEGDEVRVVAVTPPMRGRLVGEHPNLVYLPDRDFFGLDRIEVVASDGFLESEVMVVWLEIRPVLDPPVAVADRVSGRSGAMVEVRGDDLLGNDLLVDGLPGRVELIQSRGLTRVERVSDQVWRLQLPDPFHGWEELQYLLRSGDFQVTGRIRVDVEGDWDGPETLPVVLRGRGDETMGWTDEDLLAGLEGGVVDGFSVVEGGGSTEEGGWLVRRVGGGTGWELIPPMEGGVDRWVYRVRSPSGRIQTAWARVEVEPARPVLRMVRADGSGSGVLLELKALPHGRYRIDRSGRWDGGWQPWREGEMSRLGMELMEVETLWEMEWFRAEWIPGRPPVLLMERDGNRIRIRVETDAGRRVRLVASEALGGPRRVVAWIEVPWSGRVMWDDVGLLGGSDGFYWLEEGWDGLGDGEEGVSR